MSNVAARKLREWRERKHLAIHEAADELDKSMRQYGRWERGECDPELAQVGMIVVRTGAAVMPLDFARKGIEEELGRRIECSIERAKLKVQLAEAIVAGAHEYLAEAKARARQIMQQPLIHADPGRRMDSKIFKKEASGCGK